MRAMHSRRMEAHDDAGASEPMPDQDPQKPVSDLERLEALIAEHSLEAARIRDFAWKLADEFEEYRAAIRDLFLLDEVRGGE